MAVLYCKVAYIIISVIIIINNIIAISEITDGDTPGWLQEKILIFEWADPYS